MKILRVTKGRYWIQDIDMKKGSLRKQLQIPESKKIPKSLLDRIIKAKPGEIVKNPTETGKRRIKVTRKLERRAILAKNLKELQPQEYRLSLPQLRLIFRKF